MGVILLITMIYTLIAGADLQSVPHFYLSAPALYN
jgi:hypothetical protein